MWIEVTQIIPATARVDAHTIRTALNTDLVERVIEKGEGMTVCMQSGFEFEVVEGIAWWTKDVPKSSE